MYQYTHKNCLEIKEETLARFNNNKLSLRTIIKEKLSYTTNTTPLYKVLHQPIVDEWITPYITIAKQIRENFDDILIIAMGGATLNPQAILGLLKNKIARPQFHFINNTDPFDFKTLLDQLNLRKTICIVISNSGETLETIALTKSCLKYYQKSAVMNFQNNFLFITGAGNNSLRRLGEQINSTIYDHASHISGRYAGFTNISTLPGLIAGINVEQLFQGAAKVIEDFWNNKEESIVAQAAAILAAVEKPIMVNLAYLQCFSPFLEWYSQIIAESLGKNKGGFTPIRGLGPNDQHSMLQLYLEGKSDKIFTMFYLSDPEIEMQNSISELSRINNICFEATKQALSDKQLPLRTLILNDLSEKSVGALMTHSMLEIILLGHLLDINPFDQPGVESIKIHARSMLNV
ncbi:Glucose-6-phosphate isomerase [Candidatus Trichorickettsia mobilis]|uniref:Glucose-6-phosphate isomerase n=1 Tax=Candidatus Trichorickettsia mobilis TaxID=1346319 RepID=A0ABZ0UW96_9RICK|nr:hypothetical protein [Candidatus Trichorickettsia mobilis]WPY01268.1 Glucose-6-phosphate isomerase [Candidatus Trichorickettsia mobilis]